jgi:hypothetical protein
MSKNKYDEDGSIICPVCNGSAYDDNVMERYTNYVSKEDLRKYGVHFCGHCGFSGKIDWIDHASGVSRAEGADAEYFHDSITTFVALYSFTDYSPIEEIIDFNDVDKRNEVRKKKFYHLNREIDIFTNPDHTFMLDRKLFPTMQDLKKFNPDYIDDLHVDYELRHYLNRSLNVTAARFVLEVIDYSLIDYPLDGMKFLPTKGMERVRDVVDEFFYYPDNRIHFLIDDYIRDIFKLAIDEVDYLVRDMGLNTFDDIVRLVKDAEERPRGIETREELEAKGVLFFD